MHVFQFDKMFFPGLFNSVDELESELIWPRFTGCLIVIVMASICRPNLDG